MNFKQRSRSGFKEKSSDLRKVITVSGCMFLLLTVEGSNLWANSFMNPSQQVIKLSSKMQDVTVQEVLASVEQQTDYHFTYNPMQIGADRRVTIDLNNKSVTEILDELFLGKKVQYVVEGNNIVLFADNKKAEVKELGSKELQERLDAAVAALNQMEINHSISPLDSPAKITHERRMIARMKTELRKRELNKK